MPITLSHNVATRFDPSFVADSVVPKKGARFAGRTVEVRASYHDNTNGTGISTSTITVSVDGRSKTKAAHISASHLSLQLTKLANGSHTFIIRIHDRAGNDAQTQHSFTVAVPAGGGSTGGGTHPGGGSSSGSSSGSSGSGSSGSGTTTHATPTPKATISPSHGREPRRDPDAHAGELVPGQRLCQPSPSAPVSGQVAGSAAGAAAADTRRRRRHHPRGARAARLCRLLARAPPPHGRHGRRQQGRDPAGRLVGLAAFLEIRRRLAAGPRRGVTSVHPVIAATLAHNIERAIYDVSRILLYPVLIAALFCLGWAIVEVGWFLYELYLRVRYRDLEALEIRTLKARDAFAKGQPRRAYKYLQESNYSTVVARFLFDLIRNYQTERIAEKPLKLLQEYEFYTVKRLEKTRILVRVGPMLGLMGTLIPLAPALAGLAAGNTAVLAANLEIAFSVTVIGLLIGGLGFIVSIVRDRFYQQDISDLEYMLELLEGGGGRLRHRPAAAPARRLSTTPPTTCPT